jgi:ABC-2 type transport system ATP-binding protein
VATVEAVGLKREFASKKSRVVALDGVDLEVKEGEIFGLLGPNGAGKTTLIRILSTLLLPTSGRATVMGYDIVSESGRVRPLISMASGAERAAYDFISARGNLWFFSQLYGIESSEAKRRIESLAEALQLEDYLDRKMYALSTGYRQRVTIARAFINDPRLVFMDEPTIGLDVMTARRIREFLVSQAKGSRRTIFLATHNMIEGETICDRVAIIDRGKILACDTPSALRKMIGIPALVMEVTPTASTDFLSKLPGVSGVTSLVEDDKSELMRVRVLMEGDGTTELVRDALRKEGMEVRSSWKQEASLEEVFVRLVGTGIKEREVEEHGG